MLYAMAMAIAVGLGLPIAVLSAAQAQGRASVAAMEGIARQPDAAGDIRFALILSLSLIESLVISASSSNRSSIKPVAFVYIM